MKEKLTTSRQAVEWTRDLWRWMALNPTMRKIDWPGWQTRGSCISDCACCEYVWQRKAGNPHARHACDGCPLIDRWSQIAKPDSEYACVDYPDSPYSKWRAAEGDLEERTRWANKIADLAEEELKYYANI